MNESAVAGLSALGKRLTGLPTLNPLDPATYPALDAILATALPGLLAAASPLATPEPAPPGR
jgi:hypothetical protein